MGTVSFFSVGTRARPPGPPPKAGTAGEVARAVCSQESVVTFVRPNILRRGNVVCYKSNRCVSTDVFNARVAIDGKFVTAVV